MVKPVEEGPIVIAEPIRETSGQGISTDILDTTKDYDNKDTILMSETSLPPSNMPPSMLPNMPPNMPPNMLPNYR